LHVLRPWWLLGLLALPLLAWGLRRAARQRQGWRHAVDAHLLPHLLEGQADRQAMRPWGRWSALAALALALVAMAGPSLRQEAIPLWQARQPLVVALDLSFATLARDLPPSRLAQARAKLATLLRERSGGQVALVAFAEDAYTVAPLTDDAGNVYLSGYFSGNDVDFDPGSGIAGRGSSDRRRRGGRRWRGDIGRHDNI
jgi:Ca-activated chloride channel family protein